MVRLYDSASRSTPKAVRTEVRPSAEAADTEPPQEPCTSPPTRVSAVTVALAVPPAGTVTCRDEIANMPSGAGLPSTPSASIDRSRTTGSVPRLR